MERTDNPADVIPKSLEESEEDEFNPLLQFNRYTPIFDDDKYMGKPPLS